MPIKSQQPKALYFLFCTEMWERFGFYIVQGLLILYMTSHYGLSDSQSYTILGIFTALAYLSPLFGGYLANHLLGFRTAIMSGAGFLALGYALLAIQQSKTLLYPALSTIIIGNGLLKPNISSLLGAQYADDDPQRDAGFTLFYVGINIGAMIAGLSAGYIQRWFGWSASFGIGCLGILIGLSIFIASFKHLKEPVFKPLSTLVKGLFILGAFCSIALVSVLFNFKLIADYLLPLVGVALFIFLITLIVKQPLASARKNLVTLTSLIIFSIVFWMLSFQIFYSANLFTDRLVDKQLGGFPLASSLFWGSEAVFIIILGPLFARLWNYLIKKDKNPTAFTKFALGLSAVGLGFLILSVSTHFLNAKGLVSPLWVFLAYFWITVGELLISPIGLSAVTLFSPPQLTGLMMGIWFVATGFGGSFAGTLAKIASVPSQLISINAKLIIYQHAFQTYALTALGTALFIFVFSLVIKGIEK